jgi:hypothetical protein
MDDKESIGLEHLSATFRTRARAARERSRSCGGSPAAVDGWLYLAEIQEEVAGRFDLLIASNRKIWHRN